jgi:Xaa-Pro aminopeptidase
MSYIHEVAAVNFKALRRHRVETLQKTMRANGIDAYFVCLSGNVRYMTDFHMCPESGMEMAYASLLLQEGDPYLFPLSGDYEWIVRRIDWIPHENIFPLRLPIGGIHGDPEAEMHFASKVKTVLDKNKLTGGKLAVDALTSSLEATFRKALPKFSVVSQEPLMYARTIRSDEEIKLFELSTAITNGAALVAIEGIKEGVRECDVAGEVARFYFKENVDIITWNPQFLSGPNVTPYLRLTTDRMFQYGDPWYFDLGAQYLGYCSTISLFGNIGKPPEEQREKYKALYDSTQAALKVLRPGAMSSEVFAAGDKVLEEYGYKKYLPNVPDVPFISCKSPIPPRIGWGAEGIGTLPHERPDMTGISLQRPARLEKNMVFRFHPNFFVEGPGGGRLKNMVVVGDPTPRILTKTFEYGARIFDYP